ncbi:hypothetical protein CLA01_31070 [Chryseobacterium lathyri]|jgi:hypothetical protein|uniref:Uncharacterized protein n=1 Tax=Chryseobacterium lathyri TaxID=395933 RepID=A0A511YCW3_9FLAO|nr:hypothetical protein CLA01_31070 [Chryseobacterium lathyri]
MKLFYNILFDTIVNYIIDFYCITPESKVGICVIVYIVTEFMCHYVKMAKFQIKEDEHFKKWIHSKFEKGCRACGRI